MNSQNFSLKRTSFGYCFSNTDSDSPNSKFFNSKHEGLKILVEMLDNKSLNPKNASELIERLISLTSFDTSPQMDNPISQLLSDINTMDCIHSLYHQVQWMIMVEEESDSLPKFVMTNGGYGTIYAKDFWSEMIESKDFGIQYISELLKEKTITEDEKDRLEFEIENSSLSHFNDPDPELLN